MAPILYMVPASPPVRAVLITAKAIGLDLVIKEIDLSKGEHLTPEFLKLNPQHTVPTLIDDDFAIWDSHAIIAYLVSKYAKNDAIYPTDIKKRAIIDQRLHFNSGVLFPKILAIAGAVLHKGKNTVEENEKEGFLEAYGFLEIFLENKKWIAGDFISIADYVFMASVSTANLLVPINPQKFPRLATWFEQVEKLPESEANKKGLQGFNEIIVSKLIN